MTRPTHEGPPPLPGECKPVPEVRNDVVSADRKVRWQVMTHRVPDLDVDGFGSPVVLVPAEEPGLEPNTMYWRLFVIRGECGYELGFIRGLEDPFPLPGRSNGLANLGAMVPAPEPGSGVLGNLRMIPYEFDGTRYVAGRPRRR